MKPNTFTLILFVPLMALASFIAGVEVGHINGRLEAEVEQLRVELNER